MKKIIIIGGGIAGLSAGIHAQQYGFESVIYEKHSIVGGQCTGWDRKGYHIDNCIHWLTGTKEGTELNNLWKNVGALDGVELIQLDNFGTYEYEGTAITLWKDIDRLQRELIQLSPKDSGAINEFISDIRGAQGMNMPADLPVSMLSLIKLLKLGITMKGAAGVIKKTSKFTCEEYAKRFHHPALRYMFDASMPSRYSIVALIFGLATFTGGNGAIPKDGSKAMALRMEKRYQELGGKVIQNVAAEEIITEKKQATAVRFSDGSTMKADYVIAACDTKVTFDKLLKGKYKDKKFEMRYHDPVNYFLPSSVQVAFGVSADLSGYPSTLIFPTKPYQVAGRECERVGLRNYSYEKTYAPEGCTVIISLINQSNKDYPYWEKLYQDKEAYRNEKQRIANELQQRIEERFPELSGKISLLDVTTPMTYNRYTDAYQGAWMSFMMTPETKMMNHSGKIKGLNNCYLTGQWLQPPGGLPVAVTTGKFTVLRICKREKIAI